MVSKLFKRQLRRLDKTLSLKFDREKTRYAIYRRDRQNFPREILTIEDNGKFCYPNHNHIDLLYKADLWQNPNMIKEMDEYNDNLDREGNEKIHHLSEEVSKIATRTAYY
jgi:hypothetical protein